MQRQQKILEEEESRTRTSTRALLSVSSLAEPASAETALLLSQAHHDVIKESVTKKKKDVSPCTLFASFASFAYTTTTTATTTTATTTAPSRAVLHQDEYKYQQQDKENNVRRSSGNLQSDILKQLIVNKKRESSSYWAKVKTLLLVPVGEVDDASDLNELYRKEQEKLGSQSVHEVVEQLPNVDVDVAAAAHDDVVLVDPVTEFAKRWKRRQSDWEPHEASHSGSIQSKLIERAVQQRQIVSSTTRNQLQSSNIPVSPEQPKTASAAAVQEFANQWQERQAGKRESRCQCLQSKYLEGALQQQQLHDKRFTADGNGWVARASTIFFSEDDDDDDHHRRLFEKAFSEKQFSLEDDLESQAGVLQSNYLEKAVQRKKAGTVAFQHA
jgi:hypothetical protein